MIRRTPPLIPIIVTAALHLSCSSGPTTPPPAFGRTITVEVVTTGTNLDADGYEITLRGTTIAGGQTRTDTVEANGAIEFDGLGSGIFTVEIGGLAQNCNVQERASQEVDLQSSSSARVRYECRCLQRPPAILERVTGDGQHGEVASPLEQEMTVRLLDDGGEPVSDAFVEWNPQDDGVANPAGSLTDEQGFASTRWTLGTTAGAQVMEARAASGRLGAQFEATAHAAPATTIVPASGNDQRAGAGSALAEPVVALVTDAYDNAVANVSVTWSVVSGGGGLSATSTTTDGTGRTSVTWMLGSTVGDQEARATVAGTSISFTFRATATASAPSATISAPPDGAVFALGQAVTFQGSGTDPQDGSLLGSRLEWSSDLDGSLGIGTSVTASNLRHGLHTITLTVMDSDGEVGSSHRQIVVQDGWEPDDSQNTAAVISDGESQVGRSIGPESDVDWIRWDITGTSDFTLNVIRTGGPGVLIAQVFDAGGNKVVEDAVGIGVLCGGSQVALNAQGQPAGTYYARIIGRRDCDDVTGLTQDSVVNDYGVSLAVNQGTSAKTLTFESFPDGSPACSSCSLSTEYASEGVTFSFESQFTQQAAARLFESTSVDPPTGSSTNHSVTYAAMGGGSVCGRVVMSFPAKPGTVSFELRGPDSGFAQFPVVANGPAGASVTRASAKTYTASGITYREEVVTITGGMGIQDVRVGQDYAGCTRFHLDDLTF